MEKQVECTLSEINRNKNGDYYFIYEIPKVVNTINQKAKPRDELLIVGVPQNKLIDFLKKEYKGSEIYLIDKEELYGKAKN